MQTKQTEDIVFIEAFKVVKQDFISKINHTEKDVEKALGCEFEGKNLLTFEEYTKLTRLGSTSLAVVSILESSADLNEFAGKFRAFVLLNSEEKRKMLQFLRLFEKIDNSLGFLDNLDEK